MNSKELSQFANKYNLDFLNKIIDEKATDGLSAEDVALGIEEIEGYKRPLDPLTVAHSVERHCIAAAKSWMSLACRNCEKDKCCDGCPLFDYAAKLAEEDTSFEPCKYCPEFNLNCTGITNTALIDFSSNYSIERLENSNKYIDRLLIETGLDEEISKEMYYHIKNRYMSYREDMIDYKVLQDIADEILRTGNINLRLKENASGKLLKGAYQGEVVRCLITESNVVFGQKPSRRLLEFVGNHFDVAGKEIAY